MIFGKKKKTTVLWLQLLYTSNAHSVDTKNRKQAGPLGDDPDWPREPAPSI